MPVTQGGLRSLTTLAVALALVAAPSCGSDEEGAGDPSAATDPPPAIVEQIPGRPLFSGPQAPGTFVGAAGNERGPAVAFIAQGDDVVVYLCDGEKLGEWFAGPVEDDSFAIESESGTTVTGSIEDDEVTGTLSLPGSAEMAFAALPAEGSEAHTGLFAFEDPTPGFTARWIVTPFGIRGLSTSTSGAVKNNVSLSSSQTTDQRFAGVDSQVQQTLTQTQQLSAELAAARAESASLKDTLASASTKLGTTTQTSGK